MKMQDRQRSGKDKILVLESPEKVIIFFGGLFLWRKKEEL
jgi:hypothetical protein